MFKKISRITPSKLSGTYKVSKFGVRTLKKNCYTVVKGFSITGEAPKEFIRVYDSQYSRKSKLKSWPLYIAKTGKKWYPVESIVEHINNEIGRILGFDMAESQLVIENGQLRFLSKYFLNQNEMLEHGANIMAGYLDDKDFFTQIERENKEKDLFTVQSIKEAIQLKYPNHYTEIFTSFIKMLLFDAFIGLNDRHFYNWGVIISIKREAPPRFSPIFDSARSMFWNFHDDNIINYLEAKDTNDKIIRYSYKSTPKVGLDYEDEVDHFKMVQFIFEFETSMKDYINHLYSIDNFERVKSFLVDEYLQILGKSRIELMTQYLDIRCLTFQELLSTLNK